MVRGQGCVVQGHGNGRGQGETDAIVEPNLVDMVVQLQRQIQEQWALINNLQANANRVEVPANPLVA